MQQETYDLSVEQLHDEGVRTRLDEIFRFAQVGQYVNGVTHDVNNFLGAMMAYAELIGQDSDISDQSRVMLEDILASVRRSSQLLGQLTSIARPDLKVSSVINPGDLIQRSIEIRDYNFKMDRIKISLEIEPELPSICGESARLLLGIGHILSNAYEAVVSQQERNIRITAQCRTNNSICIGVWNSGLALSPQVQDKMFEPFFTTKTGPHLGLGLFYAQEILEEHGGGVSYSEEAGFVLDIPQKTPFQNNM